MLLLLLLLLLNAYYYVDFNRTHAFLLLFFLSLSHMSFDIFITDEIDKLGASLWCNKRSAPRVPLLLPAYFHPSVSKECKKIKPLFNQ